MGLNVEDALKHDKLQTAASKLARILRNYKRSDGERIKPRPIKLDGETVRGFSRDDFDAAWRHWLPPSPSVTSVTSVTPEEKTVTLEKKVTPESVTETTGVTLDQEGETRKVTQVTPVTLTPEERENDGDGCTGMTNRDCRCKSCEDFRQSKWVYPSNEPEWPKLFPNETYPHWHAARKEAVAKPCAVCGERMGGDPYLWLNMTSHAVQCSVCRETHWCTDGYEIDEEGLPSCWNHEHTREQRIAERTRDELQRAARYQARALGQDFKAAWETLLAEENEETQRFVEIADQYDRQEREQRSADCVTI